MEIKERTMRDRVEPRLVDETIPKSDDTTPVNPWKDGCPHVGEIPSHDSEATSILGEKAIKGAVDLTPTEQPVYGD